MGFPVGVVTNLLIIMLLFLKFTWNCTKHYVLGSAISVLNFIEINALEGCFHMNLLSG